MTAPVSKNATTSGKVALDAPIFDPAAFRLRDEQAAIIARARELGQSVFADRAAAYDRDAKFPTENYGDLHRTGLLGISIPKKNGGLGADYQTYALAEELTGRVKTLPGVESASFASLIPLGGDSFEGDVKPKDRPDSRIRNVQFSNVGPNYFRTMGIRVLRGREFQSSDRKGSPGVAVVNETFVRLAFPNGDALGKLVLPSGPDTTAWREIVGVVADNKHLFYGETPTPQLFSSFLQTGGRIFLQIRTAGAPSGTLNAVRRVIADVDKSLLADVRTTRDVTSLEFVLRRISTALLASMGALGLILSMIGLYGVLSWEVTRRTAEIGIHMALGASRWRVRRLVLSSTLAPVGLGIGLGVGAAMLATLPLKSFLAGVSTTDPLTIAAVAMLLTTVSVAASWLPVRRATRVDPMVALRDE